MGLRLRVLLVQRLGSLLHRNRVQPVLPVPQIVQEGPLGALVLLLLALQRFQERALVTVRPLLPAALLLALALPFLRAGLFGPPLLLALAQQRLLALKHLPQFPFLAGFPVRVALLLLPGLLFATLARLLRLLLLTSQFPCLLVLQRLLLLELGLQLLLLALLPLTLERLLTLLGLLLVPLALAFLFLLALERLLPLVLLLTLPFLLSLLLALALLLLALMVLGLLLHLMAGRRVQRSRAGLGEDVGWDGQRQGDHNLEDQASCFAHGALGLRVVPIGGVTAEMRVWGSRTRDRWLLSDEIRRRASRHATNRSGRLYEF